MNRKGAVTSLIQYRQFQCETQYELDWSRRVNHDADEFEPTAPPHHTTHNDETGAETSAEPIAEPPEFPTPPRLPEIPPLAIAHTATGSHIATGWAMIGRGAKRMAAFAMSAPLADTKAENLAETMNWRTWPLAAWALIVLGAALRIARYVANRSLWLDEAFLASTVVTRANWWEFVPPLDYAQSTPYGFLLAAKLCTVILGETEYALRLIPLVAGIAALVMTWIVAQRLCGPPAALVALALMAVSEPLIYFASEFKAYSVEAAVTLGILWLGCATITGHTDTDTDTNTRPHRPWGWLMAAGPLAILFSHSAIFVLAGLGATLWLMDWHAQRWDNAKRMILVGAVWLTAFAASFAALLAFKVVDPDEMAFWSDGFARFGFSSAVAQWWIGRAHHVLHETLGLPLPGVALVLMGLGVAEWLRRSRWQAVLVVAPLLFLLIASALQKYSLMGRLILFVAPLLALTIASGVRYLWRLGGPERRWIAVVVAVLLLYVPSVRAVEHALAPPLREEHRAALAYISAHRQPGDVLYLKYSAQPGYEFYSGRHIDLSGMEPIYGDNWLYLRDFFAEMDYLWHTEIKHRDTPPRRGWLVFSSQMEIVETPADSAHTTFGHRLDRQEFPGLVIFLYEFSPPPSPTTPQ